MRTLEALPPHALDKKEMAPFGAIATQNITVM